MNRIHKRIASAIASGSLLLTVAMPALAGTTNIEISGNGVESNNNANVNVNTTTQVGQENHADFENNVAAHSNSGENTASRNTAGNVSVDTGNSTTTVSVSNDANTNVADVDGCCELGAEVVISENGDSTDNDARLNLNTNTNVFQNNTADIDNNVLAGSNSGKNHADRNTGADVEVDTGKADTAVVISNHANSNAARIGDDSGSGAVSLRIIGNGVESVNEIELGLNRSTSLIQDNHADLENNVAAHANSGKNTADRNTGEGDVSINTGDAFAGVGIDNMANFNWADVDCDCLTEVSAKIAGNGDNTENKIRANLNDAKVLWQTNVLDCDGRGYGLDWQYYGEGEGCNNAYADANTGKNHTDRNTGDHEGDPAVTTGNADTLVDIQNSGNTNILGDGPGLDAPELPDFEFDFDFGMNWAALWAFWSSTGA